MDDEVVTKIRGVIADARWREAEVVYLFAQARKLVERLSNVERYAYARLNFYSDWCLHSEIDRSEAGGRILGRLHEIIVEHLQKANNDALIAVVRVASSTLKKDAPAGEITYCMQLTTSDTTKIIAPITPT
jgi:hypothetical protein